MLYSQVLYKSVRIYKMKYYCISDTKYVTSGINCLYSSLLFLWQCVCITQEPHGHLYKKSWQWGVAKFCNKSVRIYKKWSITGSVTPNTLPVGLIVYILLFYVHDNAFASHRSPMTIYIKSRGSGYSQVLYKTARIYETNKVLLDQWHQIRYQWD